MSRKLLINSRGNYTKFEVPGTDRFIMPVCPTQEQYVSMKLEYGVVIRNIRSEQRPDEYSGVAVGKFGSTKLLVVYGMENRILVSTALAASKFEADKDKWRLGFLADNGILWDMAFNSWSDFAAIKLAIQHECGDKI